MPSIARLALPEDVPELVRLRGVMWDSLDDLEAPWRVECAKTFHANLFTPEPDWAAYVVERPDEPGKLACCAIGVIERRLPNPRSLTGARGHVFNVATDAGYRRRGFARAAMDGLVGWFVAQGIDGIALRASKEGRPLYEKMGFVIDPEPGMWLRMS